MPVAVRLVVTYGLIVTATLTVVAGVAYDLTRRQLAADFDAQLETIVASFERGAVRDLPSPEDLPVRVHDWLAQEAVPPGRIVAVKTTSGRIVGTPGAGALLEIPAGAAMLRSKDSEYTNLDVGGTPIRALSVPLRVDGRYAGTLVVAGSTTDARRDLSALLFGIEWATALGVAMATLLGLAAIRRTLRPLRRISKGVDGIQATGDLSRRVGGDGPMDEVGRLAVAFDGMLAKLDDSFRSQQRFLSDASHELRTPLTVARGRLELLGDGESHDRASIGPVMEELDRVGRMVENLLLLARLDEGMALPLEPVEVEVIAREALVRGMLTDVSDASVDVQPSVFALADPERLLQILTNLVRNTVQHAGPNAEVTVTARGEESRVILTVADSGHGIAPEDLPHVFDRFYRGSVARTHTPTGAGLGLAIVASLIEAMNGSISVDSSSVTGTRFTISLPRVGPPETPHAPGSEG